MKPSTFIGVMAFAIIPSASAQFSLGYGAGYFTTGQKTLNNWVNNFNNNPDLNFNFGPIYHAGNFLPFYHGVTASWSKSVTPNGSLKFNAEFQNLHNSAKSIRVSWQSEEFYHRMHVGMNSLYVGAEKNLMGNGWAAKMFSSIAVRGYVANYQFKYSIGIGPEYSKKWHNKLSFFDCGVDLGAYLYSTSRARVLVHYSHSLMQFSPVKISSHADEQTGYHPTAFVPRTSFAGINLQISLGKCTRCEVEEEAPESTDATASTNE